MVGRYLTVSALLWPRRFDLMEIAFDPSGTSLCGVAGLASSLRSASWAKVH